MPTKFRLQELPKLVDKDIFVDANVLIYLYWPTGQHFFEQNYASAVLNLIRQGNNLCIDFMVISEVINRVIRIEYNKREDESLSYKSFRNSEKGKEALEDIYLIVKDEILNRFSIIESSLNKEKIEGFLSVDELDFVDKALELLCTENDLVLLTNDGDFKNSELDILTGNPRILN